MGLRSWASGLLYGPGYGRTASGIAQPIPHAPETRTSWVFDSHVVSGLSEAAGSGGKSKLPQAISAAYDEYAWNTDNARSAPWQTARERKETLLAIYLNNPWVSACVDVIAKRITSGGLAIEPTVEKPDERNLAILEKFSLRVNDDWDMLQYVRASITDELIFGDTYTEIVWKDGVPYQLYKIDGITMSYRANRYGHIEQYYQQVDSTTERNPLDPKDIVRWWFPHPRAALDPFSPIERVQDAVLLDKKMVNWMITFFQKGAKFPYVVEFQGDKDEADRYLAWFKANYTGDKNAHLPPIAYNGAKIVPSGKGSIDIDFDRGLDRMRGIVLTAYHVPPAIVGIIESGNIGGGTGEDQEKSFQYNACDPVRHTFFEKFNYRIVQQGFNIHDYRYTTRYADFRNDEALAKVQDMHVRNGTLLIDEARQESGKKPYVGGAGAVPIIITTKEITPVPRLKDLEDEARQTAQVDLQTKQAQLEKLKEPTPTPVMTTPQGATPPEQPVQDKGKKPVHKNAAKSTEGDTEHEETAEPSAHTQTDESRASQSQRQNTTPRLGTLSVVRAPITEAGQDHATGMMLAFLLDADTAKQLAMPGGEAIDDLHITLAYLGDTDDDAPTDGTLRPDTSPFKIREAIAAVASEAAPLSGVVGGLGRFFPAETETTPIIALVDVPGLVEFRTKLVTAVQAVGYHIADNHGYTPHITLDFIDASAPMPAQDVPALPLTLDTVMLCIGDKRYPFRLGDEQYPAYWDNKGRVKESATTPVMTRASLTEQVAALFDSIIARGIQDIHTAFSFAHSDYEQFADALAMGYLSAKVGAYRKAIDTVRSRVTVQHGWTPQEADELAALDWAREQVVGIANTYQQTVASLIEKLSKESGDTSGQLEEGFPHLKALASGVKAGVKAFVEWKAPQIANVTIGTGSNDGTDQAISDIIEGFTDPESEGDPNGVRVRVIPAESSNDLCSQYAGNDYSLDDAVDIPDFPIHPGCPHEREVYLTEGVEP